MPILTSLRVSEVSDLRSEASAFEEHAKNLKAVTDKMLELANSTINEWRGGAQTKYSTQFAALSDDMAKIFEMCNEYSTDLRQIADNYERAESDNQATASNLKADVDLK